MLVGIRAVPEPDDLPESLETIDVASRWVALDPVNEAAHHCLIRAQAAAGDWAAALRSYQACQAILAEELGTEPGPEIEVLARQVRRRAVIRSAPTAGSETTVRFEFTHDRIREVAYDDAGESRRQVSHRRALEMLAVAGAPAARLTEHAVRAGLVEQAFGLSLTAGDEAMRLFAMRDALGHYEQVGGAYEPVMERRRALECYEEMLVAARSRRLPAMECAALNRQATLLVQVLRDLARADELLRAALALAERSGNRSGLAETEWNLAMLDFYNWDPEGAVAHGGRALALARELGEPELTARLLDVLAYSQCQLGRWSEAKAAAVEGRRLFAESATVSWRQAASCCWRGWTSPREGRSGDWGWRGRRTA